MSLYIPEITRSSGALNIAQRRVLLCGEPGSGKTFSSITTSPNPQVLDIDKGITDPRLVKMNIPTYPIWDDEWREKVIKKTVKSNAVLEVVKVYARKLTIEQTLIIDSMTAIETAMHDVEWNNCPTGSSGNKDGMAFWDNVKEWWTKFFTELSSLNCHIILIAHLADKRDANNPALITGLRPLMDGSMKDKFGRHFTDIIRQCAVEKKEGDKIITEYKWQVKSSSMFTAKCRANIDGLYIPADFNKLVTMG
jgi:hypothetical protein